MRIMAFSDLHLARRHASALVEASAGADLVIGAGDFCNMRKGLGEAMEMLSGITAPVVAVPGNAESADELRAAAPANMRVLHGEAAELGGLTLFGLGYGVPVTPFGDWSCDLTEDEAAELLRGCTGADIVVTHSPPKGVADVTSAGVSVGSLAIRDAIVRCRPQLALCGHIHDSWNIEGTLAGTRVVNLGPTAHRFDISPAAAEG